MSGENLILQLWSKMLSTNISEMSQSFSQIFCMKIIMKESQHFMRLSLWVGCDQFCLLSNQIVGCFDHQFFWKELIDLLHFYNGDSHQGKVAPETAVLLFVGCGQVCILCNQTVGFFEHQYFQQEFSQYLKSFWMEIIIKGRWHLRLLLFGGCGQVCVL